MSNEQAFAYFEWQHPATDGNTFPEWATRLYIELAKYNRLFRHAETGILIFIEPGGRPRFLTNPVDLYGVLNSIVSFYRQRPPLREGGEPVKAFSMLSENVARSLFKGAFSQYLPPLHSVITAPLVVYSDTREPYISIPGYDPFSQLYYEPTAFIPKIPADTDLPHLKTVFSGVPFAARSQIPFGSPYISNLVAWMARALVFTPPSVCNIPVGQSPILTVSGNQPGIGKTEVVKTVGVILNGVLPTICDAAPSELHKQIGTRLMSNDHFIFLDNIKSGNSGFDSTALAAFITTGNVSVRLLNTNQQISGSNVLFALTLNDARLSPDIATRALPVRLYSDTVQSMVPFCTDYAFQHRAELYGELLALAKSTPDTSGFVPKTRFASWETFVEPRVAPFFGPLETDSATFDKRLQEIFAYGLDLSSRGGSNEFSTSDLHMEIFNAPQKYSQLHEWLSGAPGNKAQQTRLGIYLGRSCGIKHKLSAGRVCCLERCSSARIQKYVVLETEEETG